MKIFKLSDCVGVAAQISVDDVAEIAAAGYKVLINNRPDAEEGGQPVAADIAVSAAAAGLEYHHMPVTATSFPGADFDAMADLLDDPSRPVLAFCRTGTRCTNLWVASCEEQDREDALAVAQQNGFDLSMVTNFLAAK